jgi:predicted DNA-binding protein (UPF0251 family)
LEPDEVGKAIRQALETLPLAEREAVSLCYEQGLTERRAADVLDVPKSTLNRIVRRGLKRMRMALAARGFAAMAPLELARQVRGLGVPPPPETLKNVLEDLLRNGPPPETGRSSSRRYVGGKARVAGGSVHWCLVAAVVAFAPVAALAFWGSNAAAEKPLPLKRVHPARREAPPTPPEGRSRVPLRFGETVYEDTFENPVLDAFWAQRSPARSPGYASVSTGNSRLCLAAGRRANGRPVSVGNGRRLHSRVELVSLPVTLGEDGLSFGGKMMGRRQRNGSWEWGCELLAEEGRALAGITARSATCRFRMGDERLAYRKGATLILTPRGEVWLCDGKDPSRVFARKRLRPKLNSIRIRLFAAIPEARAAGGRPLAVWDRIVVRRVRLGIGKPPAPASKRN